jgi:hypothetical protein
LRAFAAADVRFLVVGAYALAHHGRPRATGDLDVWVDATPANAKRVMRGLAAFGAPLADATERDFCSPGVVFQIGVPPGRIDILTQLTGITFDEAWPDRHAGPAPGPWPLVVARDASFGAGVARQSQAPQGCETGRELG